MFCKHYVVFRRANIKEKLCALVIRDNAKGNNRDSKQLLAAVFTNIKDQRFVPFVDQISSTESMRIRKWVDNSGTTDKDRISFI